MSWDIVLFSSSQHITDPADVEESLLIDTSFSSVFENYFDNLTKTDNHCEIKGDGFSIVYFDDGNPQSNILLNLYGENAIYALIDIAGKNNWQIFDTALGQMINLNDPSKNGYQNFQSYLNQILRKK